MTGKDDKDRVEGRPLTLTVRNAADQLSCSEAHIRRLIDSGQLPAMRLGGGPKSPYRIPTKDLENYVTSRLQSRGCFQAPDHKVTRRAGSSASWAYTYATFG